MAKRKQALVPWPDNVWYSDGQTEAPGLVYEVNNHVRQMLFLGKVQEAREFYPKEHPTAWWGYDAGWCTEDGAKIKAQLTLSPDLLQMKLLNPSREDVAANRHAEVRMGWAITAVADRPWQQEWPSPLNAFLPTREDLRWDYDSISGQLTQCGASIFAQVDLKKTATLLERLTECPWYTVVLTHDQRPYGEDSAPSLYSMMPPGMDSRLLEIRAHGDQDRAYNEVLDSHRVQLPRGGSVILPSTPRKDGWSSADHRIALPGLGFPSVLRATAQHVHRYMAQPAHYSAYLRDEFAFMDKTWDLPPIELDPVQQELQKLRRELQEATGRAEEAVQAKEAAEAVAEQSRAEVLEMMEAYREHPLAEREAEARALAEEAFLGQEAAQVEADGLCAEVTWLRSQLAKVPGRSYGEVPAQLLHQGPKSWKELIATAAELMPRIRIGDVGGPLEKLSDRTYLGVWLRRCWEALEALQAYAEAKEERGASVLPHFSAYLSWPEATSLVSRNMYCPSESNLARNEPRFAAMRTFTVPGLTERVFMAEHFRIGSGRPPAPRMHVYDDTAGPTGLIHVGYIGPHLPNGKSV